MGWLAVGFIAGTFFGIFLMALAQAAGTDARALTLRPKARPLAATMDVEDGPVVLDADPYGTAVTGSFRRHTG